MARLIFAIALLLSVDLLPAAQIRGVWREIAPLPSARQEVGVAALGRDIYVLGGLIPGNATDSVVVYDAEQGSWTEAPGLPRTLHHVGAAAAGGRIYSVGGFLGFSFTPTNQVFEFDPQSRQWTEVAPLPAARGALATAMIDGRIYAVGGSGPLGDSASLFRYDPNQGDWETLASMPTPRNHHAAAAIDGKLYVVGGRRGNNLAALEIYDPATGQWATGPPMPTARSGIAAVQFQGMLFVFGGEIPGVFDEVEVFAPADNRWFSLTPMALPRHGIGAAVYQNRIIIPGGAIVEGLGATARSDEFVILDQLQILAQFADSPEIVSQLLAANSGNTPVGVLAEVRGDDGSLLPILGHGSASARTVFTLQPGETRIISTPGSTVPATPGFLLLFSDAPVLAHVLFSSDFGFAGVASQNPLRSFVVPVLRDEAERSNSGIALGSAADEACEITLTLMDLAGTELGQEAVQLSSLGHRASFIDQLFPGVNLDSFQGSLRGEAACDFAAMAILLRRDQMATLPVGGL